VFLQPGHVLLRRGHVHLKVEEIVLVFAETLAPRGKAGDRGNRAKAPGKQGADRRHPARTVVVPEQATGNPEPFVLLYLAVVFHVGDGQALAAPVPKPRIPLCALNIVRSVSPGLRLQDEMLQEVLLTEGKIQGIDDAVGQATLTPLTGLLPRNAGTRALACPLRLKTSDDPVDHW